MTMIDEALQFVLDFCQEPLSPEETVRRGEVAIKTVSERLGKIDEQEGMTTFVLGGVLKKLKEGELWKGMPGVENWWTWGEFCQRTTGKKLGTCYAKIRIWEKSQRLGMDIDKTNRLPWSVVDAVLREAESREDADRLVERYEQLQSREKFLEEVREQRGEKPTDQQPLTRKYVLLNEGDGKFYDESLEIAAQQAGKELYKNMSPAQALLFALAHWREGLSG